jgi:hypothetical protein
MDTFEEEEAQRKADEEKAELEEAWKVLVKDVLSRIRIDPKTKGKPVELFLPYEDEVTAEQIKALQFSPYGRGFCYFVQAWKKLPENRNKAQFYEVRDLFKNLSAITESPFREISNIENNGKPLDNLEFLKRVHFLTYRTWTEKHQFYANELGDQLNTYLAVGVEWQFIELTVLKICIQRAYEEQTQKMKPPSELLGEQWFGKASYVGVLFQLLLYFLGPLVPTAISIAINVGIVIWALNHLTGDTQSIWAYIGLVYVAAMVSITIIHWGTAEMRNSLKKILNPLWDGYKSSVNPDLVALNTAVNGYADGHVNLRLVRDQVIRLQTTDIKMPVQLITLLDRAIAKGLHHWSYDQDRGY